MANGTQNPPPTKFAQLLHRYGWPSTWVLSGATTIYENINSENPTPEKIAGVIDGASVMAIAGPPVVKIAGGLGLISSHAFRAGNYMLDSPLDMNPGMFVGVAYYARNPKEFVSDAQGTAKETATAIRDLTKALGDAQGNYYALPQVTVPNPTMGLSLTMPDNAPPPTPKPLTEEEIAVMSDDEITYRFYCQLNSNYINEYPMKSSEVSAIDEVCKNPPKRFLSR